MSNLHEKYKQNIINLLPKERLLRRQAIKKQLKEKFHLLLLILKGKFTEYKKRKRTKTTVSYWWATFQSTPTKIFKTPESIKNLSTLTSLSDLFPIINIDRNRTIRQKMQ